MVGFCFLFFFFTNEERKIQEDAVTGQRPYANLRLLISRIVIFPLPINNLTRMLAQNGQGFALFTSAKGLRMCPGIQYVLSIFFLNG